MSDVGAKPNAVKRVVYQEVLAGDLRKFVATSNDAASGGGARDLRVRPYKEFLPVFRKLFPEVRKRRRKDGEVVEVCVGAFSWVESLTGLTHSAEARFEPPTHARPNEGRIPVVHTYAPFRQVLDTSERLVVLLVQRDDDTVWPLFVSQRSLPDWHDSVARPILEALSADRAAGQPARGYIDFVSGRKWSDG